MKNFLHLFRNGLMLLFLLTGLNAFGQAPCPINCSSSNDFFVTDLYLGYANATELPSDYTCAPNQSQDLHIWAIFGGSTSANRYSLKLYYEIEINGTQSGPGINSCKYPNTGIPTGVPVDLGMITWVCGDEITLDNFYMSWQTAQNKGCECSNKCFSPGYPLVVRTPLIGDFSWLSNNCIPPGNAFEIYTFTDETTGGSKPYTYSWEFDLGGTSANPATGAMASHVVNYTSAGTKTIKLTVTDNDGISRTVQKNISVSACCNLSITCPVGSPFQRQTGDNPYYTVVGAEFNPTVNSTNCTGYNLSNDKNSGSTLAGVQLAPGTHTIIWTATADGQTAKTCTISVVVVDNQATSFSSCPSDITKDTDAGQCNASVTLVNPVAVDNVGVVTLTWAITGATTATSNATGINYVPSPYTFNKGVSTVTYTAKDAGNNSAVCSYTVTVNDKQAPTITACAANVTVNTDPGECYTLKANVNLGTPTATDNCGGTLTPTNNAPAQFPKGDTNVTWTVTDASGNSSTCIQKVTVVDNQNPQISCPGTINTPATAPNYTGATVNFQANASDNCPGVAVTYSPNQPGDFFTLGSHTITAKATDAAGRTATCTFTINVTDGQAPTFTSCPANITKNTDPGVCTASVVTPNPVVTDNEGVVSLTWKLTGATTGDSPATGINNLGTKTFNKGTTTVTYTAKDGSANSTTCIFTVTVEDKENPTITCIASPDPIILFELETHYDVDGSEFDPTTYSDNCGSVTLSYSINNGQITGTGTLAGKSLPVGEHTVVWTAMDASGNTKTCSFDLTIFEGDCVDLSGVCGNTYIVELYPVRVRTTTVYRGYLNTQEIIDDMIINCGYSAEDLTITFSQTVFTPNDWGDQNWETITVEDPSGQTYSCEFRVIVRYPLKSGDIYAISAGQPGFDNLDIDVQVFPNPTTGKLKVQIWNLNDPRVTAVIYNINGAVVMHKEISTTGQVDIDLTGKVSGLYLLRLVADNREFLHKIVLDTR
jgi:hypothetical protein